MKIHQALLLGPLLCTALVACGPLNQTTSDDQRLVPLDYDASVCDVPKTLGEKADAANSESHHIVASPFFQKPYDRGDLVAVLRASAVETTRFVSERLNGQVFRIQPKLKAGTKVCPMFSDLPLASPEYQKFWQKSSSSVKGDALLAGLYFEACYVGEECDEHVLTRPTILINEAQIDRWTLVHESMHHNFNRERKAASGYVGNDTLTREARVSKDLIIKKYEEYQATPSRETLMLIADQVAWLSQSYYPEILVRGAFEEIAVEGTLMDDYLKENFRYISPKSAANAIWYMQRSLDVALNIYTQPLSRSMRDATSSSPSLQELHAFIDDEAAKNKWPELRAKVAADLRGIRKMRDDARTKIEDQSERFYADHPEYRVDSSNLLSQTALTASPVSNEIYALAEHIEASAGMRAFRAFQAE